MAGSPDRVVAREQAAEAEMPDANSAAARDWRSTRERIEVV